MSAAESSDGARARVDRVVLAVVAVTVVALGARLVGLGARPFHWDEARVGYWTLRFLETGTFEYRPIAGGPFLYVVDRAVFALVGVSDATARAAVAVIGGLAPLVALVFRRPPGAEGVARYHLEDAETVAFAALLAVSPVLLYYGRFLRADVPLAVFALVVVGCTVRVSESGRARDRYLGAVALGLLLTTSAFAVGYVLCWLAAAALTVDQRRLVGDGASVRADLDRALGRLRRVPRAALATAGTVLLVAGYFYAPRSGGTVRPTPETVEAALFGSVRTFYGVRVLGRREGGEHELLPYLSAHVETLVAAAGVVIVLAAAGFLVDRYGHGPSRPIVAFHAYWAGASLLVFPVITEVSAPWLAVHTVAPALVPAAAGAGLLVRYGSRALERSDATGVAVAGLLAVALVGQLGVGVAGTAYGPTSPANPLVHHAQPADDLDPFLDDVAATEGGDVLFVGATFASPGGDADRPPVSDEWGNRLPLSWYVERAGAGTASVRDVEALRAMDRGSLPPVVVAEASQRSAVATHLEGYEASTYRLSLWNRDVVVFVR
jgi:uncharacterized protein (TIGR03663 family)